MALCLVFSLATTIVLLLPRLSNSRPSETWVNSDINITDDTTLSTDSDLYALDEYNEYGDYNYGQDRDISDQPQDSDMFEGFADLEVHLPIDVPITDSQHLLEEGLFSESETLRLRSPPRKAPEYMLNLYDMFAREKFSHPSANIVRSYMNINDEDQEIGGFSGTKQLPGKRARVHKLVFNITSSTGEEEIKLAELRLYTLVLTDRNIYMGVDRKVSVWEMLDRFLPENEKYKLISDKHVYGHDDGWEVFDVTSAVKRWVKNLGSVQVLEIRIETVLQSVVDGDMDIDVNPAHQKDPLLVVFSNDDHTKHQHEEEIHELLNYEISSEQNNTLMKQQEPIRSAKVKLSNSTVTLSRVKRSRSRNRRNSCRRKPMMVDFQAINLHNLIIAPDKYMAFECIGKCYIPIGEHLTPTKHAIIQSKMHAFNHKAHARACCVPTKLQPISVLYYDENNVITFKFKYDGMVVGECGCR